MANKIDTNLDAIVTKLEELVEADGTGVLKEVVPRLVNPFTEAKVPICGIVPRQARRDSRKGYWDVAIDLRVCTKSKEAEAAQTISEIVAAVQEKLDALTDGSTPGWDLDMPGWFFWFALGPQYLAPVGARTMLRMTIHGDLKT